MATMHHVLQTCEVMEIILKQAMEGRRYTVSYVPYGDGEQSFTTFRYYPPVSLVCSEWNKIQSKSCHESNKQA